MDSSNWKDLEALFESKGGPQYCWCMAWRPMPLEDRNNRPVKKATLKRSVDDDTVVGLLGYMEDQPVAWCSIAPRETYRSLGGDTALEKVWSLVCFFIKREYRGQGLTQAMIRAACKYARKQGAKYVEAYPVDPDSPSYRFMGFREQFEKAGFSAKGKAGTRRHVMLLKL